MHDDTVESTACCHNGSQIARARVPCERVSVWSARACDLRAAVVADRRFDRIIARSFKHLRG
eukprot:3472416-Lingulodinium_polyedra.AAC.1